MKTNLSLILLDPSDTPLIQHPTNCIKLFAEAEPTPGLPDLNYEVRFRIDSYFLPYFFFMISDVDYMH